MPFFDINPIFSFITFSIWLIFFVWGRAQFNRIKKLTQSIIVEEARIEIKKNKSITLKEFYDQIYPSWCDLVKKSIWFIPHKSELWPMPAKPDYVRKRIGFNHEWTARVLLENGIELKGREVQEMKGKLSREKNPKIKEN